MLFSIANISPRNHAGLPLRRIIMFSFPPRAALQAHGCPEPLSEDDKPRKRWGSQCRCSSWGPRALAPVTSPLCCGSCLDHHPIHAPAAAPAPVIVLSVHFPSDVHSAAWTGKGRAGFGSTPRWGEHHPRGRVPGGAWPEGPASFGANSSTSLI